MVNHNWNLIISYRHSYKCINFYSPHTDAIQLFELSDNHLID